MKTNPIIPTQHQPGRIAGLLFLISFFGPLIYGGWLFPELTDPENPLHTAVNVLQHEGLLRSIVLAEFTYAALSVCFGWVLYTIFKPVSGNLSLLALLLKVTESLLIAVNAAGHYSALLMIKGAVQMPSGPEKIYALYGLHLNHYYADGAVPMFFLGLNSTLFLYLFFRSGYINRWLAAFGMAAYMFIFIYSVGNFITPHLVSQTIVQVILFTPSILLEVSLGLLLLIRGVHNSYSADVSTL